MVRATNLFAAASVALLISGLVLANFFAKTTAMAIRWPGSQTAYGIGYHVPCYGLAGLFAVFACFYAVGRIQLGEAFVDWHLGLSLAGVVLFGVGFALFALLAAKHSAEQPGQLTLLISVGGMLLGPLVFLAGQLLFVIAFLTRLAAQHS